MNSPAIFVERRKHFRAGVMAQLEDITYSLLRKHGVASQSTHDAATAEPVTQ